MKKQKNTSQTKGVARALIPFTQKINEINNINFHQEEIVDELNSNLIAAKMI